MSRPRSSMSVGLAAAGALIVALVVALAATHAVAGEPARPTALPAIEGLGGDFELSHAGGKRVRLRDFRGRVVLLFFGYTHCPDVCPTTLVTLKRVFEELGGAADRVRVVMITVDPERDSAEYIGQYVRYFNAQFVGLSGTAAEIERVARQYRVYYRKGERTPRGGYPVSHSAFVYLLDGQGRVRVLLGAGAKSAEIAEGVRQLLQEAEHAP